VKRHLIAVVSPLLLMFAVVAIGSQTGSIADAGAPTMTTSPIPTGTTTPVPTDTAKPMLGVRFVGAFVNGPADGVTVEWDAAAGAASYSIQGNETWLAVRQGEGVCVPAPAAQNVVSVATTVAATITTFVIPRPQAAPDSPGPGLVWFPSETSFQVTALDQQGRAIASGALAQVGVLFAPCPDLTATPSPTTAGLPMQLPNTGYGPDSY
jgi:hypothetical protein